MSPICLPELPLLKKELVGLLRTRRAFWLLAGTVVGSALLSLIAWPSVASGVADSRVVVGAAGTFLLTQLTAALVIVPAFAAGAISGEREQGTYELLLATQLSPALIVVSKAMAAAGFVILLLVASAPGVILLQLLGGVTFWSLLRCEAVTLGAVVLSTFICLWASMRSLRTSRAIVLGVGGVILWNGGLFWILSLIALVADLDWLNQNLLASATFALCPHLVIALEVFGGQGLRFTAPLEAEAWWIHLGFASVLSGVHLLLLLRRAGQPEAPGTKGERLQEGRAAGPLTPVVRPFLTWILLDLGREGGVFGNPVFLKEIRTEFFGRLWYRRRRFWGLFVLFGALVILADVGRQPRAPLVALIAVFLVALLAPGVAASAFPREIEHGNLDLLRGTLVPLRGVLHGKFLASLYASFGTIAAAGWWIGIAGLATANQRGIIVAPFLAFAILVLAWLFVTSVATCASVLSRRTGTALVGSYAVLLALLLALPLAMSFLRVDFEFSIATHPAAALATLVEPELWHPGALALHFILYGGSTFLILGASGRAVDRLRERDP